MGEAEKEKVSEKLTAFEIRFISKGVVFHLPERIVHMQNRKYSTGNYITLTFVATEE